MEGKIETTSQFANILIRYQNGSLSTSTVLVKTDGPVEGFLMHWTFNYVYRTSMKCMMWSHRIQTWPLTIGFSDMFCYFSILKNENIRPGLV